MRLLSSLLGLVCCTDYTSLRKVNFEHAGNTDELRDILEMFDSVDIWAERPNRISFSAEENDLADLRPILEKIGELEVVHGNLEEMIRPDLERREERERTGQLPSAYAYNDYLDFDEYMDWLDHVTTNHGSNLTMSTIATTVEGREIVSLTIPPLSPETVNNPGIVIDCGIHAREWISPAMCRLFVHELMRCTEEHNFDSCDPVIIIIIIIMII